MKASEIDRIAGETGTTLGMGQLMERTAGGKTASWTDIPSHPGIYVVYLPDGLTLSFSASTGRARQPIEMHVLRKKWRRIMANGPMDILYIGKGGGLRGLRQRVSQLIRFGMGLFKAHKGGKGLWQTEQIAAARILVRCCPKGREERLKSELLLWFWNEHGDWPLANRGAGTGG